MEKDFDPQEAARISRHNRTMEAKHTKSPTLALIIDVFGEEAKLLVPKEIKRLERELRPFYRQIKRVRDSWYDLATKSFIELVIKEIYMPKKKVEHLKSLKMMERLMCKATRGVEDHDIERAKSVSIWDLYPFEKRKGSFACCPFHPDKTPSFQVKRNRFICYGCGVKGDSIDFIQKLNNLTFYRAVEVLNGKI